MEETYLSDEEYQTYFPRLNNLRQKIADDLPIRKDVYVLDLATGYGYFALQVAKLDSSLKIVGIDISESNVSNAWGNTEKAGLADQIEIIQMDAADMKFPSRHFDIVVNFLGLEDIHMTRGRDGLRKTFLEVKRVLKPNGYFCFVVMPPEEMETAAQKTEIAVFSYICGATWLSSREYEGMLENAEFKLRKKRSYYTGKKLSPNQAETEIRFACENVPRIYGVKTPSFEEVWARFGKSLEEDGLGHYSKVVSMIAQKIGNIH